MRKLSKQTIHVAPKWTNEYPTWNSLAASLSPSSVRRSWQLATWDCMAAITKSTHAFSYAADAMAVKRKKTHDRSLVIQSTDVYATRRRTNLLTAAPSSPTSHRQRLRPAQRRQLDVPRHNRSTHSRRSFSVAVLTVWNSLPDELRDQGCTEGTFRQSLKTYLFAQH